MAEAKEPQPGQFFAALLSSDEKLLRKAVDILCDKYSSLETATDLLNFDHTSYYNDIGSNLIRIIISFQDLIPREAIVDMKLFTNELEILLSDENKREINIDPGYMTLSNVFLASCKDFYHRVYLTKGIFLENEYRYVNKRYEFWPWTYPDYKRQEYLDYFYELRKIFQKKLKL